MVNFGLLGCHYFSGWGVRSGCLKGPGVRGLAGAASIIARGHGFRVLDWLVRVEVAIVEIGIWGRVAETTDLGLLPWFC
jgi:hypothetical protein